MDDLRGTPMSVGTLEEIIDDNHAIVSTSVGSEHYVSILPFVDKDLLEPGCYVLLNHKVSHWPIRKPGRSMFLVLDLAARAGRGPPKHSQKWGKETGIACPRQIDKNSRSHIKTWSFVGACCDRGANG